MQEAQAFQDVEEVLLREGGRVARLCVGGGIEIGREKARER
jgi:hypothetical protein